MAEPRDGQRHPVAADLDPAELQAADAAQIDMTIDAGVAERIGMQIAAQRAQRTRPIASPIRGLNARRIKGR